MSTQHAFTPQPGELYCRETQTLVEVNRMRPGYDCRCSGCVAWVKQHGDPMRRASERRA